MAQTIQIRRGTGSAVPSSLAAGELAINLDSGKLFYGNGSAVSSNFRVNNLTAENYIVCSSVSNITTQALSGSTAFGDSADDTHQFTGNITATGDTFTFTSANANDPLFVIKNTTDDANGPILRIHNQRASDMGDDDEMGIIQFSGRDSGTPSDHIYAQMKVIVADASDGNESGKFILQMSHNGSLIDTFEVDSDGRVTLATDLDVSQGGTGASSLTNGGVLLGSGTNAITAMAVLANGEMIVGDGSGDPVAESGATLRTSIGVGTTDNVAFANITSSGNISASGDLILGGGISFDGDETLATIGSGDDLTINPQRELLLGTAATDAIKIGRQSGTGGAGRTEIYANTSTVAAKFQDSSITFNHPVTASGNISASGNIIGKDGIFTRDNIAKMEIIGLNSIGGIVGTDTDHDLVFRRNNTEGFRLGPGNHITASGNISSSGDIIANSATFDGNISASHAYFGGSVDVVGNIEANSSGTTLKGNIFLGTKDGSDAVYIARYQGTSTAYPYAHIFAGHSDYNEKVGFKISVRNNSGTLQDGIIIDGNTREVTFANVVNCTALNTGQGDNELYAMNQDVETSDNVQFNQITTTGDISMSGGDLYVADDIFMKSDNAAIFMGDSGNEYTVGVGQGGFIINAGVTNPASVNHFIVSASGGTATNNARVGIGTTPHSTATLNVTGSILAEGATINGDITLGDTKKLQGIRLVISASNNNNIYGTTTFHQNIALNGTTTFNDVISGDTTLQGNLRLGGSGDTSNNWISIDAQNGNDSSGGGITFYETGTYDVDSPQYGAKIVYNEDDDEFAIGTMDNNTFKRQIYMKRNLDYLYLANRVYVQGTSPLIVMANSDTTVADGDTLGQIVWNNEDDDGSTLNLKGIATEDHASGANGGSKLEIQVTPNGTSALATAATIDQDKSLHVSGSISSDSTIKAGWHGSTTRIKILVSDFIPDDVGRPAMIDDTSSDRFLESFSTGVLFASIPIPTGFKATHVRIYGSGTSAMEVSEMDITGKTVTSKGTGNIGTELNITDVTSTDTNYLLIELAQASSEEVYGGYVTIAAV